MIWFIRNFCNNFQFSALPSTVPRRLRISEQKRKEYETEMLKKFLMAGAALTLPVLLSAQTTTERATTTLTADLIGSNENPAVDTPNTGQFTITMGFDVDVDDDGTFENIGDAVQNGFDDFLGFFGANGDDDDTVMTGGLTLERDDISKVTVSLQGDFQKPQGSAVQTITGLHIHDGGSSENGPVVVGFGVSSMSASAGMTSLSRSVMLTTEMDIDAAIDIARNPGNYYLNLHTSANPSGEVRGQLERSPEDENRRLQRSIHQLTDMVSQLSMRLMDVQDTVESIQNPDRERQLNRIDENVAAIGRRNGLNTSSEQVVSSAN